MGVSLEVEDLHGVYEALSAKGVEFNGEPEVAAGGGLVAHFEDLDGNVLTLCERARTRGR